MVRGHVIHEAVEARAVFDDESVEGRRITRLSPGDQFVVLLAALFVLHRSRFGSRPGGCWES